MKFRTAALVKIVNDEIASRISAAEADLAGAEAEYEREKQEWLASEHPQALATAARSIVEKVRKGRLVTHDDLGAFGGGYRSANHAFSAIKPEQKTKGRQPNVAKLEALRDFLAAVSDDEVTSSGLRDVGFRNIGEIIRAAAGR